MRFSVEFPVSGGLRLLLVLYLWGIFLQLRVPHGWGAGFQVVGDGGFARFFWSIRVGSLAGFSKLVVVVEVVVVVVVVVVGVVVVVVGGPPHYPLPLPHALLLWGAGGGGRE